MAKNVGEKIRLLRVKANLSQEELAQKLYFSNSTISNWEKGLREVSMENLQNLATFFGVKVSYFIDQHSQIEYIHENSFQQIKFKEITISKKYFYLLLSAMLFNALLIFIPFENRDIPLTLNILFWMLIMVHAISRYITLDKRRTKNYLVPLAQKVNFISKMDIKECKYIYKISLQTYGLLTIYSFIFYLSMFGMFNEVTTDPMFSGLVVVFILFTFFLHINELIRQWITKAPKNVIPYNRENIDFGMYRHRTIVTTHYVGIIFFLICMNLFGVGFFHLEWLLANLIVGFFLVILLHIFLIKISNFFHKYQLVSDSDSGKNHDILSS
jgi:transcriptional regulator with XRE-family HTH domain